MTDGLANREAEIHDLSEKLKRLRVKRKTAKSKSRSLGDKYKNATGRIAEDEKDL